MTACPPNLRKVPRSWKKTSTGSTPMGDRLKKERMRMGYTVKGFASVVGCTDCAVTGMENRGVICNLSTIVAMAQVLNCSLDWLVLGEE